LIKDRPHKSGTEVDTEFDFLFGLRYSLQQTLDIGKCYNSSMLHCASNSECDFWDGEFPFRFLAQPLPNWQRKFQNEKHFLNQCSKIWIDSTLNPTAYITIY